MNPSRLFTASCIALIATAMSFAIRGDIMGDFERVFVLDKVQVGWIGGAAFWGFGLSILFGGPLCDILGMGTLLRLAAIGHIGGVLLTIFAADFTVLFAATVIIGIANGLIEAAVNPLIATIYSTNKTAKLTALHAWFPGGIVIGGVLAFVFTQLGLGWQAKMLLMLIPAAIYAFMFFSEKFPPTEREAAGVSSGAMFGEVLPSAVPRDLHRDVADRRHRARPGTVGQQHLQRGDAQQRAGRHPRARVDQRDHVPDAPVLRRHLAQGLADLADRRHVADRRRRPVPVRHGRLRAARLRRRGAPRHRHRVLVADDAGHYDASGSRRPARWGWR